MSEPIFRDGSRAAQLLDYLRKHYQPGDTIDRAQAKDAMPADKIALSNAFTSLRTRDIVTFDPETQLWAYHGIADEEDHKAKAESSAGYSTGPLEFEAGTTPNPITIELDDDTLDMMSLQELAKVAENNRGELIRRRQQTDKFAPVRGLEGQFPPEFEIGLRYKG